MLSIRLERKTPIVENCPKIFAKPIDKREYMCYNNCTS